MLIDQLPEIVKQAAQGLSGANLTVLNGADGLGEIATGLVGQGLAIFDSLRGGLGQHQSGDGSDQIDSTRRPMTGPDHRTNNRMCYWGTGVREPARLR